MNLPADVIPSTWRSAAKWAAAGLVGYAALHQLIVPARNAPDAVQNLVGGVLTSAFVYVLLCLTFAVPALVVTMFVSGLRPRWWQQAPRVFFWTLVVAWTCLAGVIIAEAGSIALPGSTGAS